MSAIQGSLILLFKGNYEGLQGVNFNIIAKALSNDLIDISETRAIQPIHRKCHYLYTNEIKFAMSPLIRTKDYTLSYTDNEV